jgi:hypothetical protein
MTVLRSNVDTTSETYIANRKGLLELIAEHDEQLAIARAGGGERYNARHKARGKLLPRERIELLLDRDAPFLELSPIACWGTQFHVGGSIITGMCRSDRPGGGRSRLRRGGGRGCGDQLPAPDARCRHGELRQLHRAGDDHRRSTGRADWRRTLMSTKTELRQPIGMGMLYLQSELARAEDPVFDAWAAKHHGEFLTNVSGALSVRRYELVQTKFSSPGAVHPLLTVYQLAEPTTLDGDEYREHTAKATPMPDGAGPVTGLQRTIYRQITPASGSLVNRDVEPVDRGQLIGSALMQVTADVDPEWEEAANSWYDEEHLPDVASAPGVLSARRFIDRDAPPAPGARQADGRARFLALYELEDPSVLDDPAFLEAGKPTARRTALGDHFRAQLQVYRQVFPEVGAFTGG